MCKFLATKPKTKTAGLVSLRDTAQLGQRRREAISACSWLKECVCNSLYTTRRARPTHTTQLQIYPCLLLLLKLSEVGIRACVCQCLLSPTETRGQGMGTTMYGAWSLDLQARKAQQRHFLAFWHGARTEAPMRMPRKANGGRWRIPGAPAGWQPSHRRYFRRHRRLTTPRTTSVAISISISHAPASQP